MVTDAINIQAFEFSCKSEEIAREVQLEIEYNISVQINQIISSVLEEHTGPETYLKIDKIEIDLGDIALQDFGKAEMLIGFKEQFTQKINELKQDSGSVDNNGDAVKTASEFEMIRSLLLHGDVPWWADKNAEIPVDAILQKMIRLYPRSLIQFLQEHRDKPAVLVRLTEQCKPSTRSMMEQLVPGITASKINILFTTNPGKIRLRSLTPARLLQLKSILNSYNQTPVDKLRRSLLTKIVTGNNLELVKRFLPDMGLMTITNLLAIKDSSPATPELEGARRMRALRKHLKHFIQELSVFQIEFLLSQLTLLSEMATTTDAIAVEYLAPGNDESTGIAEEDVPVNVASTQSAGYSAPPQLVFHNEADPGNDSYIFLNQPRDIGSLTYTKEDEYPVLDKTLHPATSGQTEADRPADDTHHPAATWQAELNKMPPGTHHPATKAQTGVNIVVTGDQSGVPGTTKTAIDFDHHQQDSEGSENPGNWEVAQGSPGMEELKPLSISDIEKKIASGEYKSKPFLPGTAPGKAVGNADLVPKDTDDNGLQDDIETKSSGVNMVGDESREKAKSYNNVPGTDISVPGHEGGNAGLQSNAMQVGNTESRTMNPPTRDVPNDTHIAQSLQNHAQSPAAVPGDSAQQDAGLVNIQDKHGLQTVDSHNLPVQDNDAKRHLPGIPLQDGDETSLPGSLTPLPHAYDKNLLKDQEIIPPDDENPVNRQISFIMRKLQATEPALVRYLQKLPNRELEKLVESFKNHIRESRDRRKMIRQILDHPYLLKYNILDIFSSLSFEQEGEPEPGSSAALKKPETQKENILSAYAKKIQLSQTDFLSFINKLSLKELVILKDIFQKEKFDSSREKSIIRKILYKLPLESVLLIKYLTALSEEEIKHLFSSGNKKTSISNLPENRKSNVFYDDKGVEKIIVENAGLCLIANYLSGFFKRLGYVENKQFKNKLVANRALYILQYMVTGKTKNPEYLLQLNKLLCGFEVEDYLIGNIRLTKKEIFEADELLSAVIENWKQLKNTSLDGFRGSFLQRKGILFEKGSSWTLQVEKKGYDLLLNTIPWGFGLIKLPWMKKHIVVEW